MSTSLKWQKAEQLFHSGISLFEENRFEQALLELQTAEEYFRKLDAQGHPFAHSLSNGVTGLANALAMSGRCYHKLGNTKKAISCFETSLINSKFEKPKPFQAFTIVLYGDLAACYEKELARIDEQFTLTLLNQDSVIDTSFRFPFSLSKDAIPFARLYELAPERYPQFRDFYQRAKKQDAAIRKMSKSADEPSMKRMTVYVWGILFTIWAIYGVIMIEALFRRK